jgi:hypothetical protein
MIRTPSQINAWRIAEIFFFEDRTRSILLIGINIHMDLNIPLHLQRQMAIVIRELQNIVGLEVTKAYLGWATAVVPVSAVGTDVVLPSAVAEDVVAASFQWCLWQEMEGLFPRQWRKN